MKKKLNPNDWLPKPEHQAAMPPATAPVVLQVEYAIQALEAQQKDLTSVYPDWVRLCYALIEGTGAQSREFFHRISRFHPEYDAQKCDRQYERCQKSTGSGITIASFFHHVKEAGIEWRVPHAMMAGQEMAGNGLGSHPRDSAAHSWDGSSRFGAPVPAGQFNAPWPEGQEAQNEDGFPPLEEGPYEKEQDLVVAMENYRKDFPITDKRKLPLIPQQVYDSLPHFLKQAMRHTEEPAERDTLLLGCLTVLSAALPNIFGTYYGQKLYPNMFLFVTAPAASGKGKLNFAKNLIRVIDKELREKGSQLKQEYEQALAEFNADKKNSGERPQRPPKKMLLLPGNSSASGMIQLLGENNERGLLFETEADTVGLSLRSEFGDYSDILRKIFHHENVSLLRRTENEYINLEEPAMSMLLAGTPNQVKNLIRNAENGLFSRFSFYYINRKPDWIDVFDPALEEGLDAYYLALGEEFARFHKHLEKSQPLKIALSKEQRQRFHQFWTGLSFKYQQLQPADFMASLRRMGVTSFRLMMVLSSIRLMEEGTKERTWICHDTDFDAALLMAEVLLRHASHVFYSMPMEPSLELRSDRQERLYENLPPEFDKEVAMAVAAKLDISGATLYRELASLLKSGLLKRMSRNKYEKPADSKKEL